MTARRHLIPTACVLCVLGLVGCAGPRPDAPVASAVTAPAEWRSPSLDGPIDAGWWADFGDPALAEAVQTALEHNTDVAIAATRVEQARATFRVTRSRLYPMVTGDVQALRSRDLGPFGVELMAAAESELTISYDLDLFGALRDATKSDRARLLSTAAARDNVQLAVAASTATSYIALVGYDERLEVLHRTLRSRADSLRVMRRQANAGYASQLELAQAESEYRATEAQIPAAELAVRQQEDGLSILLGESPRSIVRSAALGTIRVPLVPTSLPSTLLRRRPDIVAAEQTIVAADRTLDAARAQFLPDVRLSASFGLVHDTLLTPAMDPARIWNFGGSVLVPLLEGGRLHAQADLAAAVRDEAAFAYRKTALVAFGEVENALAAVDRLAAQEDALDRQRAAAARTLDLATKRFRAGYSSYIEQLDAERALLSVDLSLVQSRSDRLSTAVKLYQALGGGWSPEAIERGASIEP